VQISLPDGAERMLRIPAGLIKAICSVFIAAASVDSEASHAGRDRAMPGIFGILYHPLVFKSRG
jgi:hypothetical protein